MDGAPILISPTDPLIGAVIATIDERYVIQVPIGQGGTGRVYVATTGSTRQRVAVKVPFGDILASARQRERLLREARAMRQLRHPNVVTLLDVAEDKSVLFLVMEFIEGRTIAEAIRDRGVFSAQSTLHIARQIVLGLQCAHEGGLVHRDLKAANVILTGPPGNEIASITDFGAHSRLARDLARLTDEHRAHGTLTWMSPEQAAGITVDARSDLFNVGLLMYHMLTGHGPHAGSLDEQHERNITVAPPPLAGNCGAPDLTTDLDHLVRVLLARNREQRPASAAAVIELIDAVLKSTGN